MSTLITVQMARSKPYTHSPTGFAFRKPLLNVAAMLRMSCGMNSTSTVGTGPIDCSNIPMTASPIGSLPKRYQAKHAIDTSLQMIRDKRETIAKLNR